MLRGNKPNAAQVRHIPRQLEPGNINLQRQAHIIAKLSNAANAGPNGIGTWTVIPAEFSLSQSIFRPHFSTTDFSTTDFSTSATSRPTRPRIPTITIHLSTL
jgi:hypothetical protein